MERKPGVRLCNGCGKTIAETDGLLKEDIYAGYKEWGYFSKKDLRTDRFILCEECYDRITRDFMIPVYEEEKREVL